MAVRPEHRERLEGTFGDLIAAAHQLKAAGAQRHDESFSFSPNEKNEPVSLVRWRAEKVTTEAAAQFAQSMDLFLGADQAEERQA